MRAIRPFAVLTLLVVVAASAWSFLAAPKEPAEDPGPGMTAAANAFLDSLDDKQKAVAQLDYDTPKRVGWHFIPMKTRKGLVIREMNKEQRAAAHALLESSLSELGYDKATKIMQLESLLYALEEKAGARKWDRDSEKYYVTIFGTPDEKGRWGFSFEGHHLSLNFVVDKNKVLSTTPTFYATNPALVKNKIADQLPKGTRVLAKEETLAFKLVKSLDENQRKKAIIDDTAPREIRAAGEAQPPQEAAVGIPASELNEGQTKDLRRLITEYAKNLPEKVTRQRISAIRKAGFENVHFAWAGADKPGVGHYYRVQGPTFLIEFVNTQPDAAGNPANHIHCVWRDPSGDFAIPIE
jgi:hypothetical protein